ncbi:hypothetical protein Psyc_0010 [Psychrobacter arcticus 273-4]|uniref:Uncharacterized protein n=1 Tax=Psychrobacter arcticus (strain DSM 17307 / VKM B-2377 / 273-4) TaxID=259536 RepID=Q4FVS4_PSYA2|nr:hypothetical protein [Psychrobacter arcticus]AAZ17884.1 hypothetical protein Psyc_0010 [Psychrobacter arcticus 273-4]
MDKKQLEDIFKPSVMERMNEIQRQIDPLHQIRSSSKISEMMGKNARVSSVANIGEIARKASQQSGLDFASFENQSTIARYADLGFQDMVALQDTFLEARRGLSAYSDTLSMKDRMIQSIGGNNAYKDMMASFSQFRESIEPLKGSFNAARAIFETSESFKLVKEIQSQAALVNSLSSEYSSVFKQFESLRNLESFKAISRLENFPNDKVWTQNYDKAREITEDSLAEAKNIDASISDEVSSVDDFNKLSEERQSILLSLYSNYYYPIILTYLVIGIWWNIFLNENLDLSNRVFVYFESTKGVFSYLGTNFYLPSSGVIDGLVASFIYMKFPEFKKNSKDVGVKKAIKMLFYSSDSVINRSMLKGCRVITEDNTYLRESHHADAIGIEILSKGTIVRVVGKEGKSWLLVEPLFNTEIGKGWILRSDTITFK